jgi:maltooligosyltrehalose trehalohydrolase
LDAQWNDDFHHALHTLLTGERSGYYVDFGRLQDLAKAHRDGFVYSGEYSAYRRRRHGNSSREIAAGALVVFGQNHDQIGNRMQGERLSTLVSFEKLKLAAGIVLLSPFMPLLFMGEEYGETAPFQYFVSHSDAELIEAVRRGRQEEFAAFDWQDEPPDPQSEATFLRAKLNHALRREGDHAILFQYYCRLIRLRQEIEALATLSKEKMDVAVFPGQEWVSIRRWSAATETLAIYHLGESPVEIELPLSAGAWRKQLDSSELRWNGPGSALPNYFNADKRQIYSLPGPVVALFSRQKRASV